MNDSDRLFERAREADIEAVAGVKLWRAGRRLRGECPICHASAGKKADGAFSVDPRAGLFKCFACDKGGDVITLEMLLAHCSLREAAERLAAPDLVLRRRPVAAPTPSVDPGVSAVEKTARILWREARRAHGTPAETYLRRRGIAGDVLEGVLAGIKFHPSAYWGKDEETGLRIFAPAIVIAPETPAGLTGGVHVTYLGAGGLSKLPRAPAKRMWGPQADAFGRKGGVWLIGPRAPGPIIEGEGLESTASAGMLYGKPCRLVATLSLGAMQGGWLADQYGRYDPDMVSADPDHPPFTWPLDEIDAREVIIAVDRDMKPLRIRKRRPTGGTVDHWLTPDQRARICGGLAVQAWRRANPDLPANAVRLIAPGGGKDFNNELLERGAA